MIAVAPVQKAIAMATGIEQLCGRKLMISPNASLLAPATQLH